MVENLKHITHKNHTNIIILCLNKLLTKYITSGPGLDQVKANQLIIYILHYIEKDRGSILPIMFKAYIDKLINNNQIVIFSKSYCPYGAKAKKLLELLSIKFTTVELDKIPKGSAVQSALVRMTGQKTIPNIWINCDFIGGCDDIHKLHVRRQLIALLQ